MSWSETKHAINSSLGTSSFLPLDKKIDNLKTAIGVKQIRSGEVSTSVSSTSTTYSLSFGMTASSKSIVIIEQGNVISSNFNSQYNTPIIVIPGITCNFQTGLGVTIETITASSISFTQSITNSESLPVRFLITIIDFY